MIPVNSDLEKILRQDRAITNLGLLLDKYHANCPRQEDQKIELHQVAALPGNSSLTGDLLQRRRTALSALGARLWTRKTAGPLTLQLSRAGSFENAGICLHPVYGFVYLPGTGIKGMTRAFATTVAHAPVADIEAVFGKTTDKDHGSASGEVVFHDAWPVTSVRLTVDIVNNHHKAYYEGTDERNPPDDFESPNPVSFLSVVPDTEFEFAVAPRREQVADARLLSLAREWLDGALTLLGAGAKTNAGYGRFKAETVPAVGSDRAQFVATLTLVTPAFVAGANQERADCELRPATIRGLLRWWWRTLHTGHLRVSELRELEAKIWGNTKAGGAVSIQLEPVTGNTEPERFDWRAVARRYRLDEPPNQKTAQGALYAAFGMQASGSKPDRHFLTAGATWRLTVTARTAESIGAGDCLEQARLALWLLGKYGGVGAKSRRGFGSLAIAMSDAPDNKAEALLRAGTVRPRSSKLLQPISSSLCFMHEADMRVRGNEPWYALDQLGYAYQAFASKNRHNAEKLALGLPRKIDSRPAITLRHPAGHQRHSSPLHFHLSHDGSGYSARVAAFHNPTLPNLAKSGAFLRECTAFMETWVRQQGNAPAPQIPVASRTFGGPVRMGARPISAAAGLKVGDRVSGTLVERNSKGTWKVKVDGFPKHGPIHNSPKMPDSVGTGDTVLVEVRVAKPNEPAFTWIKEN